MDRCLSDKDIEMLLCGTGSKLMTVKHRQHLRVCDTCAGRMAEIRASGKVEDTDSSPETLVAGGKIPMRSVLEPNVEIGDFRIEKRLGTGGMGVVYQAYQKSLKRRVALKVLGGSLLNSEAAVERFQREARAAAKLQHPNIVSIYEEGVEDGVCYFAMELVEGKTVSEHINELRESDSSNSGREDFLEIAKMTAEAARALAYAHEHGVIHRDIKPSNLMLSESGRLMITDFGIARISDDNAMTVTGSFVGTPLYMSPEQLKEVENVDHRTDVYSLGVTLYELITLRPLFERLTTHQQAISHILSKIPDRPRSINDKIPVDLETICLKALESEPGQRYQNADEFADDLMRFVEGKVIKAKPAGVIDKVSKFVKRHKTASVLSCCILAAVSSACVFGWMHLQDKRVEKMIPRVTKLVEQKKFYDAFVLAKDAESVKSDEPMLKELWPKMSRTFVITTEPSGADIFIRNYFNEESEWIKLGTTPIEDVRVPFGTNSWKVEKKGYIPKLVALSNEYISGSGFKVTKKGSQNFIMQEKGKYPDDMVWIPPSDLSRTILHNDLDLRDCPAYLIDKFEVTNKKYKKFVDQGGYANEKYWRESFVKDGSVVSWKDAMPEFVDSTGKQGPSTWVDGSYPEGQGDHPVSGVSWYEAAAYARFAGKELPTAFHWMWASLAWDHKFRIVEMSNYGDRIDPVGVNKGMGRYGMYDGAGNVREWCYNAVGSSDGPRCLLGGAFGGPSYLFWDTIFSSPWDRELRNGFRCVRYLEGKDKVPAIAFDVLINKRRLMRDFKPQPMQTVQNYIDTLYQYDKTPLNVIHESSEEREHCRIERVSYDAAYPDRITAVLLLPKNAEPPYQTCVWWPGSNAVRTAWKGELGAEHLLMVKSGRAVLIPFYQATYNRRIDDNKLYQMTIVARDVNVQRALDLRRSIDYIESREDLDCNNIAYVGYSWGASIGPVMMAVEDRIKTGVFLLGGLCGCDRHPAYDAANFSRFVKAPVMMINGVDDSIHTYESQKYIIDTLGTDEKHKKHVLFPTGHSISWEFREEYNKILLDWLDRYQGKVIGKQ